MLVVGLTGGIGSGKSTVARMLAARGAIVVDADQIAREVVEPGEPAFERIVQRFGPEVVGADGRLDRAALAARVFGDEAATADLNGITHPAVGEEFLRRMAAAPSDAILVLDVPLLVETAQDRGYDVVVVVEAPLEVRLARLAGRGVARDDAVARMARQATDDERRAVADVVVENGGSEQELAARVEELWADLRARHAAKTAGSAS